MSALSSSAGLAEKSSRIGQPERYPLVEVHDEHLVLRVAGSHESQRRSSHVFPFPGHAPAVIDDQPDCHRHVFMLKDPNRLWHAILIDLEVLFPQTGDKAALPVSDGRMQHNQVHIHRDGRAAPREAPSGRKVVAPQPEEAAGGNTVWWRCALPPEPLSALKCPPSRFPYLLSLSDMPLNIGATPRSRATATRSDPPEAKNWRSWAIGLLPELAAEDGKPRRSRLPPLSVSEPSAAPASSPSHEARAWFWRAWWYWRPAHSAWTQPAVLFAFANSTALTLGYTNSWP